MFSKTKNREYNERKRKQLKKAETEARTGIKQQPKKSKKQQKQDDAISAGLWVASKFLGF